MTVPTSRSAEASSPTEANSSGRERIWATAAGLALMLAFSIFYLKHSWVMNEADPRLLSEFKGGRPYQLRVLIPALLYGATHWFSLELVPSYQVLIIGFTLGLFGVFKLYLAEFCPKTTARWLALGLVVPLFVFYSNRWFYLYDVPATFFATLSLLLLSRQAWRAYLVVFVIATFNRESSLFVLLAFVLTMAQILPRSRFAGLLAAQIGIWLAIRALLNWLFAGSPGAPVEHHFEGNMLVLREALLAGRIELGFAVAGLLLLALGLGAIALRAYCPPFLRRAGLVTVPFLAVMLVVGVVDETRIYGELIPFLLTPALVGFYGWNRFRLQERSQPGVAF